MIIRPLMNRGEQPISLTRLAERGWQLTVSEDHATAEWIALAQPAAGEPIFHEVVEGGGISPARLSDRSVARIIKHRLYVRMLQLGRSEIEAQELATICSGHSLRAGFCTAAADKMPEWKIRKRCRHKTPSW